METMADRFDERKLKCGSKKKALLIVLLCGLAAMLLGGCGIPKKQYHEDMKLAVMIGEFSGYRKADSVYKNIRGCQEVPTENPYQKDLDRLLGKH